MAKHAFGFDVCHLFPRPTVASVMSLRAAGAVAIAVWIATATVSFAQSEVPKPVLVELFTSEGCSSCPPADALLIELDQRQPIPGVEVIALGHHVDYWNGIGWADRFSSRDATLRQQRYTSQLRLQSPYTPELVVDGHLDVVGNDRPEVRRLIADAARAAKPATVKLAAPSANVIRIEVEGVPSPSDVMLAITESDLSTSVRGGENGGRELRHTAVVRTLRRLGSTADGRFSASVPVVYRPEWNRGHLRAVVFAQQGAGPILGVGMIALKEKP